MCSSVYLGEVKYRTVQHYNKVFVYKTIKTILCNYSNISHDPGHILVDVKACAKVRLFSYVEECGEIVC